MLLRRGLKEADWQAELRQRSEAAPRVAAPGQTPKRKRLRQILVRVLAIAWVAALFGVYESKQSHDSGVALIGAFLLVTLGPHLLGVTIRAIKDKWDPPWTVADEEGDVRARIRHELGQAGLELRRMLSEPTERAFYERWLETEKEQLDLIAPSTADRWERADTETSEGRLVSGAQLDARRRRLLDLYSAVSSPEQLADFDARLQAPSARAITSS